MSHDLLSRILQEAGPHQRKTRLGRGEGSKGKTSGRGQKGAGSRAGPSKRIGFEGGQTEIYRRFPKRGFSNAPFETKYHVVNLGELARFDEGATVDKAALKQAGLIPNTRLDVKILGQGEVGKKLNVVAARYSRSAHTAITEAGGTTSNDAGQPFEFAPPKNAMLQRKLNKKLGISNDAEAGSVQTGVTDKTEDDAPNSGAESAKPTGDTPDVTEAPESGDRDEAPSIQKAAGEKAANSSESPTEAPESGDKQ